MLSCALLLVTSNASADGADPWWGQDKAAHFAAASVIGGLGYAVGTALFTERSRAIALGLGAALAAGALKEGFDAAGFGDPSWKDFAWDAIGGACGVGIAVVFDVGVHGGTAALTF